MKGRLDLGKDLKMFYNLNGIDVETLNEFVLNN